MHLRPERRNYQIDQRRWRQLLKRLAVSPLLEKLSINENRNRPNQLHCRGYCRQCRKITQCAMEAKLQGATCVDPELSLCGYPPEDYCYVQTFLMLPSGVTRACAKLYGITVIVGHPHWMDDTCFNAASVLQDGKVLATYHKHVLPNYAVLMKSVILLPAVMLWYFSIKTLKLVC